MKAKTAKTLNDSQRRSLQQISHQVEIALTSDETSEDVKECLKTIIIEASNEAGMPLGDFSLVRAALPNIIENLNEDYGRGVIHSIHAIIQYNTGAFQKFYDDRLDQDLYDLAELLSQVMKHPKMPEELVHGIKYGLNDVFNNAQIPADDTELDKFEDFTAAYNEKLFEKYYAKKSEGDQKVSDLPQQPEKDLELNSLANLLSKVMTHPKIPTHLYNTLADELNEVHVGTDSPDNILANLKAQLEREKESEK